MTANTMQDDYIELQGLEKIKIEVYDESTQNLISQMIEHIVQFDSRNALITVNKLLEKIEFTQVGEMQYV